jgi:GT2 family glycosyltransferase
MERVSIVIPVWNAWRLTRACLASLAPTLADGDEVIVVDNGSDDETAAELARLPGVRTIRNPANRGFAAACNQGAAAARRSIVVFLNNDTLMPAHWREGLLAPFADAAVVATGPLSNCASGEQWVRDAGGDADSPASYAAFAARWRRAHRGLTAETTRLVGFCLAVRASALQAIGGWDERFAIGGAEDDDLCLRLMAAGGRLRICREVFVFHHGHATFDANALDWFAIQEVNVARLLAKHGGAPLLTACLIVRDEAPLLPACLAALAGVVDEIVVYDTGSSDGSQAAARAAGARVVQGYWDDDFGRARNAALAHCTGDWVLSVDADELFAGDAAAVRRALAAADVGAFTLDVVNLGGGDGGDVTHRACRVFRRAHYRWRGRLHEQVTERDGGTDYPLGCLAGARLIHSGYLPERIAAKHKGERNLRIAARDAARGERVDALVNLGRSYMLAGQHAAAVAIFARAGALDCDRGLRRVLCRSAAQACLALGRAEAALPWIDELARVSASPHAVRHLRGAAYVGVQRWADALANFAGLDAATDEDGMAWPMDAVPLQRVRCRVMLQQWEAAAAEAAAVAAGPAPAPQLWPLLTESFHRSGRAVAPLLDRLADADRVAMFAALADLAPAVAHGVLEELVEAPRYRVRALAAAIRLAPSLPLEQAVRWSARLRAVGLVAQCPLRRRAADDTQPVAARLMSAAAARTVFGDEAAIAAIRAAARGAE